jgi:hypothetical protein
MGNEIKLMKLMRSACLALALLMPCLLAAQPVQEHTIKAAFVYNFVLFTEWPQNALRTDETINVCINAASGMRESLQVLNGKTAKGLRLKVLQKKSLNAGLGECHVLYIDSNDRQNWSAIKKSLSDARILTISDDEEIGGNGAMIALALNESKIVFDINQGMARQANLTFSSKLLRLARTVR